MKEEIIQKAFIKAKKSQNLLIQLEESLINEEDFSAIYENLKTDEMIRVITIDGADLLISVDLFSHITWALLENKTCFGLILRNFKLDSELAANMLALATKQDFYLGFDNVSISSSGNYNKTIAWLIKRVRHIIQYNIYWQGYGEKVGLHADFKSLIKKGLVSLNVYKATPQDDLKILPTIIREPQFRELNITECINIDKEHFSPVLDAIAANPNFTALRITKVQLQEWTWTTTADKGEDPGPPPGDEMLERLIKVIKDHPTLKALVIDDAFCSNQDLVLELLETIAAKNSFIELSIDFSEMFAEDYIKKLAKVLTNNPQLQKLNIPRFNIEASSARYMRNYAIKEFNEINEETRECLKREDDFQEKRIKSMLIALQLHPAITFISEEFVNNPLVARVCDSIKINLNDILERNKIIQGLSLGNQFAILNSVKKLRTEHKLSNGFFATEEWQQRNVPSLTRICINKIQDLIDSGTEVDLSTLPESLSGQFSFKK